MLPIYWVERELFDLRSLYGKKQELLEDITSFIEQYERLKDDLQLEMRRKKTQVSGYEDVLRRGKASRRFMGFMNDVLYSSRGISVEGVLDGNVELLYQRKQQLEGLLQDMEMEIQRLQMQYTHLQKATRGGIT